MEITDFTSIIQTVAVVAAAIAAIRGLNTWRKQQIGQRQFELAEEALTLAYELQGIIDWARHPVSLSSEGHDRPGRDDEPENLRSINDAYYAGISRLSQHEETFAKMRTIRMRFKAHFGDSAADTLETFVLTRNKIEISASST